MKLFQSLVVLILITCLLPATVAYASRTRVEPALVQAAQPTVTHRISFIQLGSKPVLPLRSANGAATVYFGSRADELITKATLHIRYAYSPALIAAQSHIKLTLNDEVVGVLPISKESAGRDLIYDVEMDPRLIVDFNKLVLNFIGHYSTELEDPMHNSLWADVSGSSELELTGRSLALNNDLAMLPEPFFDRRDPKRVIVPFIFGAQPSRPTLRAAAVAASWFGQLASWRGARFPAHLDRVPAGHAVVFATNTERPAFLSNLPPITAPRLGIMTNPTDGYSKLLLILGRDGNDLKMATDALVLGSATLSGATATVTAVQEKLPRMAYDAPNWVRLDRPMKFGELVETSQQLQVQGRLPELEPDLVRINLRVPPDLFTWRSRGVPMDLKFRYTPPMCTSESRLSMSVNDELLKVVNLRVSDQASDAARLHLPLPDAGLFGGGNDVFIPAFKMSSRNQLQFYFNFTLHKEGNCRNTQIENVRAMIDADSRIDFTGYPHYAEMPHLGYFVSAGFPFTKYADLAQTAVVLPEQPSAQDIETMLTLLGRMGESTGYPAIRVRVVGARDEAMYQDADILIIGASPQQSLLDKWGSQLPAIISGPARRISQPARSVNFLYDWLGFGTRPDPTVAGQESIDGNGPLAALLGFESPLKSERSVVAVTAVTSAHLAQILDALDNPAWTKLMHGSVVFIHPNKVESFLAGPTYAIGSLPVWSILWILLFDHPMLLATLAALAVLILAYAIWRTLKAFAARRLRSEK